MSAQQNTTDTVRVTNDNDDVVIHSDSDTNLSTTKSGDILTISDNNDNLDSSDSGDVLEAGEGTFTQLASDIKNGGTIITLNSDYKYVAADSAYKSGIVIDKSITINGNGKTIDGSNLARIFTINANNI